jgi:transcriptional regulator
MVSKRKYKTLTTAQSAKVKRYTKQGKTQQTIAKILGVSKQRVSTAQAKAKIGKRRPSTFWGGVAQLKDIKGITHRQATIELKYSEKWRKKYKKRTGKERITLEKHRQEIMCKLREEFIRGDEMAAKKIYEQEDITPGDTPH